MATDIQQFQFKVNRAHSARIAAEKFVLAGGDLKSIEAVPLGVEMIAAWDDLVAEFVRPILTENK
jgi:hypothetical protein